MNDELPWATVAGSQIQQQQSSDILNNQVLPGTRANNYWDNFRSYSRQNPLSSSTTPKCNIGEQFTLSETSSTRTRGQSLNNPSRLLGPGTFENKMRLLNLPSNSINKASDKNSSTTRSQNMSGARTRYYVQQGNGGGRTHVPANSSSSSYQRTNSPSGLNYHHFDNNTLKRNNRRNYVPSSAPAYEAPDTSRHPDLTHFAHDTHNANAPLNSSNSKRLLRDRGTTGSKSAPMRIGEGNAVAATAAAANLLHRRNVSQEDALAPPSYGPPETFEQVAREAELLMEKHSEQPQFLLQLFHHAAKLTSDTDQQVALDLLRAISYQRHQNNIQHNRWDSNTSAHSENVSNPSLSRDAYCRNMTRFSKKNSRPARGISGSDASESGVTSDDDEEEEEEESKVLYQMVNKNLTPTSSSSIGLCCPLRTSPQQQYSDPSNNPSSIGASPIHVSNSLSQSKQTLVASRKDFSKEMMNIANPVANKGHVKMEVQLQGNRAKRETHEVESSYRNYLTNNTHCDAQSAPSNSTSTPYSKSNPKSLYSFDQHSSYSPIGDKHNNTKRQIRKSPRRNLSSSSKAVIEEKSNFATAKNAIPKSHSAFPGDVPQEPVSGFESLVSASLREVLLCFENADYSLSTTPQILDNLHHSLMRQVQFHSSTLGFSSNFGSSIGAQLKATLRDFYGKSLPAIRQDLAAAVSQVLIQEYCTLFMQQENPAETKQQAHGQENCPNEIRSVNKRHEPDSNKRSITPHNNSLFGPQVLNLKHDRINNPSWSLNPIAQTDIEPSAAALIHSNVLNHSREGGGFKCEVSKGKGGGAISKNSGFHCGTGGPNRSEDSHRAQEGTRESPLPEASSFPESWVVQRGGSSNPSDVEGGGVYSSSFPESSFAARDKEEKDALGAVEHAMLELNDAEADQDEHVRNKDFINATLQVQDLAEADQSQDAIEAECGDSSIENDHYDTNSGAAAISYAQETNEFPLRFGSKKKDIPEQGLDEVPTRLLNAVDGTPSPLSAIGRRISEDNNEARIPPHRYGPYASPLHSQAANAAHNDQSAFDHAYEPSSGKGG